MSTQDSDKKSNDPRQDEESAGNNFYEKWKDPAKNKMGNDVSSEIKIANSGGQREEGYNNEWHMEEDSEKGDEEIKKEQSSS